MSSAHIDFDFRARRPAPPLGRFVESIWYARGQVPYARERIAPTGSSVGIFVLGDPLRQTPDDGGGVAFCAERGLLIGPHDRPVVNEPLGETFAVGIVTTPIGCRAVFGADPSTLRTRVLDLEAQWPAASAIRERLAATEDPDVMLELVEKSLAGASDVLIAGLDRCERAVGLLETDPTRSIAGIAAELAVSHGHLDREFTRIVGVTPRALSRLLRVRRLLAKVDVHTDVTWAPLAAELGWFDQAHLIRDFKRHTGVTPSEYIEAQRAMFDERQSVHAAGFVPET